MGLCTLVAVTVSMVLALTEACTTVTVDPASPSQCVQYDLSILSNTPVYTVKDPRGYEYFLGSPCAPIPVSSLPPSCAQFNGTGIAYATSGNRDDCYLVADQPSSQPIVSSVWVNGSLTGIQLTAGDGEQGRVLNYNLVCDESAGAGTPVLLGEYPTLTYNFVWKSAAGCASKPSVPCPPQPPLPTPTEAQLALMDMGLSQFLCYNINPFATPHVEHNCVTPEEECLPASLFNPTGPVNTDQWVDSAKNFGAGEVCLTAHHEGGFCLWDSEFCDGYSVMQSPYKHDIVADFVKSCAKYDIRPCFYVNPNANGWLIYHQKNVTADEYMRLMLGQHKELLTKYGKIARLWWDHYDNTGNARLAPAPPSFNYTSWETFVDLVRDLSPDTILCPGPDCTGHLGEAGTGSYPTWYNCDHSDPNDLNLTCKERGPTGTTFHPLETCATPLVHHQWFAAGTGEGQLDWSLSTYANIFFDSVGKGYINTINVTPGTTGLVPDDQVAIQAQFGEKVMKPLNNPVASASNLTAPCATASFVLDIPPGSGVINVTQTREDLRFGQRISGYSLEGRVGSGAWVPLPALGQTVGARVIDRFPAGMELSAVRFNCTAALRDPIYIKSFSATLIDL